MKLRNFAKPRIWRIPAIAVLCLSVLVPLAYISQIVNPENALRNDPVGLVVETQSATPAGTPALANQLASAIKQHVNSSKIQLIDMTKQQMNTRFANDNLAGAIVIPEGFTADIAALLSPTAANSTTSESTAHGGDSSTAAGSPITATGSSAATVPNGSSQSSGSSRTSGSSGSSETSGGARSSAASASASATVKLPEVQILTNNFDGTLSGSLVTANVQPVLQGISTAMGQQLVQQAEQMRQAEQASAAKATAGAAVGSGKDPAAASGAGASAAAESSVGATTEGDSGAATGATTEAKSPASSASLTPAQRFVLSTPFTVTSNPFRALPSGSGFGLIPFYVSLVAVLLGFIGASVINPTFDSVIGVGVSELGPKITRRPYRSVTRVTTYLAKACTITAIAPFAAAAVLLIASLLGVPLGSPVLLWLLMSAAIAAVGWGALAVFAVFGGLGALLNMLFFTTFAVASAGATVPLTAIPRWLAWLNTITPVHPIVRGVRSILFFNARTSAGLGTAWLHIGLGAAFALVFALVILTIYDHNPKFSRAPQPTSGQATANTVVTAGTNASVPRTTTLTDAANAVADTTLATAEPAKV